MHRKFILSILFAMLCSTPGIVTGQSIPESAPIPSLIESLRFDTPVDFCGEKVPLDDPDIRERMEKEFLLILWDRAQIVLWMKRAGRYMPYFEKTLRQNGLPDDLKYVAVIESSLLPTIGSSMGAVGYWQFIRSTGQRYNLTIDRDFDERRSLEDSTIAAIRYFKDLHAEFRNWTLSVAAYNMGEAGLRSRIQRQKVNNYYHLDLPTETERHLFKIISVKLILENPRRYGFHFEASDLYSSRPHDRVVVKCYRDIPFTLIAEAAGTYYKKIKDLNPHILGSDLAKGNHTIKIPKGAGEGFHKRYLSLLEKWNAEKNQRQSSVRKIIYRVKRGDSLGRIAQRHGVSIAKLAKWNGLNYKKPIYPGQRIIIYKD